MRRVGQGDRRAGETEAAPASARAHTKAFGSTAPGSKPVYVVWRPLLAFHLVVAFLFAFSVLWGVRSYEVKYRTNRDKKLITLQAGKVADFFYASPSVSSSPSSPTEDGGEADPALMLSEEAGGTGSGADARRVPVSCPAVPSLFSSGPCYIGRKLFYGLLMSGSSMVSTHMIAFASCLVAMLLSPFKPVEQFEKAMPQLKSKNEYYIGLRIFAFARLLSYCLLAIFRILILYRTFGFLEKVLMHKGHDFSDHIVLFYMHLFIATTECWVQMSIDGFFSFRVEVSKPGQTLVESISNLPLRFSMFHLLLEVCVMNFLAFKTAANFHTPSETIMGLIVGLIGIGGGAGMIVFALLHTGFWRSFFYAFNQRVEQRWAFFDESG